MSTRILLLLLSLSVVSVTAAADCRNIPLKAATTDCGTDDNAQANRLFVEAAKLMQQAEQAKQEGERLGCLVKAQAYLEEIIECKSSSDLAVQLISGQEIGNDSMVGLEARIKIAEKNTDTKNCSEFGDSIRSALGILDHKVRDSILASIARKQVRVHDFQCASETIGLIINGNDRQRLRSYLVRARVRADLRAARQDGK